MNILITDIEYAIKHNPSAISPVSKKPRRDEFFELSSGIILNEVMEKYVKLRFIQRVNRKVYRLLSKDKSATMKVIVK